MCILHIVFCTVCKYVLSICKLLLLFFCTVCPYVNCLLFFYTVCPYVNCLLFFLHCLEHAHKNFTHQGTCAVVMWQYKWFDLIWFEFALWSMPTASFVAVMWLCQFDKCFKALFCKGFDVPYSVWREPIMPVSTYSQSFCIFVWCWRSPCSCTSLSCAADLPELLTEIWI